MHQRSAIAALVVSATLVIFGVVFAAGARANPPAEGVPHTTCSSNCLFVPAADTPTNTATSTPSDTPTNTATNTPSDTPTNTATSTPSDTPTNTPTNTASSTPSDTPTNTPTNTASATPTNTPTITLTFTPSNTPTITPTNTTTTTPSNTPTLTATATATPCFGQKPKLHAPKNKATLTNARVHFDWADDPCALSYHLVMRRGSKTGPTAIDAAGLDLSEYDAHLVPRRDGVFFWRVQACNASFCGSWSKWRHFFLAPESGWNHDDWMLAQQPQLALR